MTTRGAAAGRAAAGLLLLALVIVNAVNALNKGGDFRVYVESGERVIAGTPMYQGSGVGEGVVGPPFQAVFFVPFAAIARASLPASRLAWYACNLVLLACGVWWWARALAVALGGPAAAAALRSEWWRVALPALAILHPLQTNFEHQNLNVTLLALGGAAALTVIAREWIFTPFRRTSSDSTWDKASALSTPASRSDTAAGLLLGFAAALKAFPALLVLPALERRRWRIVAVAAGAALVLTLTPVLRYGVHGYAQLAADWLRVGAHGGWPIRGNNQSLFGMIARFAGPDGIWAAGHLDRNAHPGLHAVWLGAAISLLAVTGLGWAAAVRRAPLDRPLIPIGMAAAQVLAVVLSPIAWDHYWVLMYPPLFVLFNAPRPAEAWSRPIFWTAAFLLTALSRATVGAAGLALVRALSLYTIVALVLLAATLAVARQAARATAGAQRWASS